LIRLRQALREAMALLVVAAALGFIYTAATEKGLFARTISGAAAGATTPQMISAEEVWSLFQSGSALFVDSRHDFDYRAGHIKGAINVPLKDFDVSTSALRDVARDRLIVIYCDGADCNSSIELAVKLAKAGFKNTRISFGGWREWVEAKHPTEQSR
jgi:rhodanese-related sulfurtransferase